MTLSQALEAVGSVYVPGVVQYYGRLSPDPWFEIHEDLERIALHAPESIPQAAATFVRKATDLIARFKQEGGRSKSVSPADAFAIGDEDRMKALWSVKHHECYRCREKTNLKLEAYGTDALQVRVVCEQHKVAHGK